MTKYPPARTGWENDISFKNNALNYIAKKSR